ncbi:MAG: MarR family transcriptional regulator [Reyranella sp.]|nr:MarR family transcriptional regulator [Reyranella sp.]
MTDFPTQTDRTGQLIAQRRRETPGIPLDGMEILSRANRLVRLSRKWIEPVFTRHGLDTGEFDVLATLRRSGAPYCQRPTELYHSLMITSGGLTDRLNRLEKKGFIERIVSETDRRSALVQLTATGLKTTNAAFVEDMAIENELLRVLGDAERRQLATLLARLLGDIEQRD